MDEEMREGERPRVTLLPYWPTRHEMVDLALRFIIRRELRLSWSMGWDEQPATLFIRHQHSASIRCLNVPKRENSSAMCNKCFWEVIHSVLD
jgi:hypothetical protein